MAATFVVNLPVLRKVTSGAYLEYITKMVKSSPKDTQKLQAVTKTIHSNSVASRAQRAAAIMQAITHCTRRVSCAEATFSSAVIAVDTLKRDLRQAMEAADSVANEFHDTRQAAKDSRVNKLLEAVSPCFYKHMCPTTASFLLAASAPRGLLAGPAHCEVGAHPC